ncbi:hypothetical protein PPL_00637 [Heterostelium album PN500]|uniref:Uncharacterized protein n=1 Tax=Heterostelium pallidum (strain ATCC 26659 / Pp 5 / PN500) TaxID=670386 RepID=D3AX09_HETP5|nr:hypothetical protein PPL_00637 [Heterostelium album PN500]EFA86832.1 hypothetical protein PPL_00637 [Heterostelium album PN500]|eukprot:XP_020438935.1 hypothetical protein PPL_00637 [Heterostelium album PN500]
MNRFITSIIQRSTIQNSCKLKQPCIYNYNFIKYSSSSSSTLLLAKNQQKQFSLSTLSFSSVGGGIRNFSSGGVSTETPQKTDEEINEEGRKMIADIEKLTLMGQYDDALALCDRLIKTNSFFTVNGYLIKSRLLLDYFKNPELALEQVGIANSLVQYYNPSNQRQLRYNIKTGALQVYYAMKKYQEALSVILEIIDQHSESVDADLLRSAYHFASIVKNYQQGHNVMTMLENRFPQQWKPTDSIYIGLAELGIGNLDKAAVRINVGLEQTKSEIGNDVATYMAYRGGMLAKGRYLLPNDHKERLEVFKILFAQEEDCLSAYMICECLIQLDNLQESDKFADIALKHWNDHTMSDMSQFYKDTVILNIYIVKLKAIIANKGKKELIDKLAVDAQAIFDRYRGGDRELEDKIDVFCMNFYFIYIHYVVKELPHDNSVWNDFMSSLSTAEKSLFYENVKLNQSESDVKATVTRISRNSKEIQAIITRYNSKVFKIINFTPYHHAHQPFEKIGWEFHKYPTSIEMLELKLLEDQIFDRSTFDNAMEQTDKLIQSNGKSVHLAMKAYLMSKELDNVDQIWNQIDKALKADKYDNEQERILVQIIKGMMYMSTYSFDEGLELAKTLLEKHPNSPQVKMFYVRALVLNGDATKIPAAIEFLKTIVKTEKYTNPILVINSLNRLGFIQLYLGNGKEAMEYFTSIYESGLALPQSKAGSNYFTRRGIFDSMVEIIISDYNQILKLRPDFIEVIYSRALANIAIGNRRWSLIDLQKIEDLFQEKPELLEYEGNQGIASTLENLKAILMKEPSVISLEMRNILERGYTVLSSQAVLDILEDPKKSEYYRVLLHQLENNKLLEEEMALEK